MRSVDVLHNLKTRALFAFKGVRNRDKIRLLLFSILYLFRGVRLPLIRKIVATVTDQLVRGTIVYHKGLKYYLVDDATVHFFFEGRHEPWMWDYLASLKEDDVFVDVGAHIGLYSIYAASLLRQGKVVAIEPNPKNYKALFKAIQLNRLKNVVALNIAAWSKECRLPLYIKGSSDPHSLVSKSSKYIIVRAMKLDDCINKLGLKKISLIKIDVEGAEVQVIDGLCNTLRAHRPKLVVEVTWSNINIIYRLLGEFGYSFFIIPASAFKDICYIYAWPNN